MSYTTVKSLFRAICDAIRAKEHSTDDIEHQDIPDRISKIETNPEKDLYIDDGKTRLLINTRSDAKFGFYIGSNTSMNKGLIDWGDGSTDTVAGYGDLKFEHTYSSPGQYIITIEQTDDLSGELRIKIYGTEANASSLHKYDIGYSGCIYAVSVGAKIPVQAQYTGLVKCVCFNSMSTPFMGNVLINAEFIGDGNSQEIVTNHFRDTRICRIELPSAITAIGAQAFYNCINLMECVFPGTLTSINDYCFYMCRALDNVDLPTGTTSLGVSAFYGCLSLKTVVLRSPTVVAIQTNTFNSTPIKNGTGTIYVPQALIAEYQAATNWSDIYNAGTQFLPIEGSQYEQA